MYVYSINNNYMYTYVCTGVCRLVDRARLNNEMCCVATEWQHKPVFGFHEAWVVSLLATNEGPAWHLSGHSSLIHIEHLLCLVAFCHDDTSQFIQELTHCFMVCRSMLGNDLDITKRELPLEILKRPLLAVNS